LEEALLLAEKCDFWLNVGQHTSLDELCRVAPHFAGVDAVKYRRVYNNTRRTTPNGGSDFWESGTVHPDLILADLIKILHYEAKSEELYYYEQLQ
jgi:iron complex transport system substrate-binding protein